MTQQKKKKKKKKSRQIFAENKENVSVLKSHWTIWNTSPTFVQAMVAMQNFRLRR